MTSFVHIPKNGGNSVVAIMKQNTTAHRHPTEMEGDEFFAISRDPYTRFISMYRYIVSFDRSRQTVPPIEEFIKGKHRMNWVGMRGEQLPCIWAPQCYWIYENYIDNDIVFDDMREVEIKTEKKLVDPVFRLEDPDHQKKICNYLNIEYTQAHKNKERVRYTQDNFQWDEESRKVINDHFDCDFNLLGYAKL